MRVDTDLIQLVSTRRSRSVAAVITPVRPIPPTVAQNSSGWRVGTSRRRLPLPSTRQYLVDPRSEAEVLVMVLAVDVRGDGTADGNVSCTWDDRQHQPARKYLLQQPPQADTGLHRYAGTSHVDPRRRLRFLQ